VPSVSQCLVTSLCTKLEQWVRKTASENRRRWCGRDVARQVVLGVDSGDRKSSVANSRQSCTAERQWCGQRRVFTIRNMSQTAVFYSTQSNGNDGTTIVGLLHTKTVVAYIPLHAAITALLTRSRWATVYMLATIFFVLLSVPQEHALHGDPPAVL